MSKGAIVKREQLAEMGILTSKEVLSLDGLGNLESNEGEMS